MERRLRVFGWLFVQFFIRSALSANCEYELPCPLDHYCSESRDVCRSCEVIKGHCPNRTTIVLRFPTCDAFCTALELKKVISQKDAEINLLNTTITNSTQFPLQSADSGFQIDKLHIGLMVTCVVFMGLVITLAVCLWRAAQQQRQRACHSSDNKAESPEGDCDETPLMEIVSGPPPTSAPPPEDNGSGYETGSNPSRTSSQRNSPAQERKGNGPSQLINQPTSDDNGSQRELALPQEVKLKPPVQDVSASIATV